MFTAGPFPRKRLTVAACEGALYGSSDMRQRHIGRTPKSGLRNNVLNRLSLLLFRALTGWGWS